MARDRFEKQLLSRKLQEIEAEKEGENRRLQREM